jgi:hypothetical protein
MGDQQMGVKETVPSLESWKDPFQWRNQLPREVAIHQLIDHNRIDNDLADRHLIEHRGHRLMMSKRKFRLYLEFCSGGNLYSATAQLFDEWTKLYNKRNHEEPKHIPEAYI